MDLRLYITSSKYKKLIDSVKEILDKGLSGQYNLRVVNVLDYPELAEQDNIIATPTLINLSTNPPRRIIGCMTDKEKVLMALNL